MKRRDFLKAAGLSIIALGTGGVMAAPLSRKPIQGPGAGPAWAMAVRASACERHPGCRDCIDACHTVHNVPAIKNPKQEIKWIWTAPFQEVFPDLTHRLTSEKTGKGPVLVLCNHCENPPCVRVCPTKATFRREDGVVMMDYHRCIGCRYCMAACPYGARSFNWRDPRSHIAAVNVEFPTRTLGVVEKCNFCEERLTKGLVPACAEACREKAILFGDLNDRNSEVAKALQGGFTIRRKAHLGTEPRVYYLV